MAFVSLGSDYIKSGYTAVDNVFLLSYLPFADATDVKIYLLGLAIASVSAEEDNSLEKMALALHIDGERVAAGFRYWEEKGLVSLTKTAPFKVKYLSVKNPLRPVIKVNTEKYKVFCDEVARLFPEKIISPNEFNEYFELMHTNKMEINAMLLIMQYCKDLGGGKFSAPYILAVANDWVKQGMTTEKKITDHIAELENNSEDIRQIFKVLGLKRAPGLEDRQLFLKWTNKLNYSLETILAAAKYLKKRGGIERLDEVIEELLRAGAFSAEEARVYLEGKEKLRLLAVELSKTLGTYYGSTDGLVESYIQPWLNQGFDGEALTKLAKFCFLRNIRSFDGLSQMVERFYKNGIISAQGIDAYVAQQMKIDVNIKEIFARCNHFGTVGNRDRECYRMWNEWGFGQEAILLAAENCAAMAFPIQAINRVLASLRARNAFTAEEVKKALGEITTAEKPAPKSGKKAADDYLKHEYTEEQLKSVLVNFDDWVD